MMAGLLDWFKSALKVVFEKSGLVGISVVVGLALLVVVVLWWLFGPGVLSVFASPHGYGG
jgi:hypothetical protein